MPRKRVIDITESLDQLRRLAADNAGTPAADAIRVLIALGRNPAATTSDIAAMIGCAPREVERTVAAYRARGITGLLERTAGRGIRPEQLEELRAEMSAGKLETLEEIRLWLEERFGLRYTTRGIGKLIQRELGARRMWVFEKSEKKPAATVEKMLRFVNGLKASSKLMEDIDNIRSVLRRLLPDIDRVSIYINVTAAYDIESLHSNYSINNLLSIVDVESTMSLTENISLELYRPGIKPSELLIEHFTSQGMPVHQYSRPATLDYYNSDDEYIGSILLWTYRSKAVPSDEAIDLLERLRPFIVDLLTVSQERYDKRTPTNVPFHRVLDSIANTSNLSGQEHRIIAMRLFGHTYQSIADSMHISKSTVHKHLISVHRKTGTSSIVEIFAKYFTPGMEVRGEDAPNEE